MQDVPFIETILHPTDFSDASERAFAHALAIALFRRASLQLLHVTSGSVEEGWAGFPAVRRTLERWGLLPEGSPRSAVPESLGVPVAKVAARGRHPRAAILRHLEHEPADMVVLSTEGRGGLPRLLQGSVAEDVARVSHCMTLFVPENARGIVSVEDGDVTLRRVLVPIAHSPSGDGAVKIATRFAEGMQGDTVEIELLHVGDGPAPEVTRPTGERWRFEDVTCPGDPIDEIVRRAEAADLVVMVTDGRNGLLDALRGSHSEQVLRRVGCPLLVVPEAWLAEL